MELPTSQVAALSRMYCMFAADLAAEIEESKVQPFRSSKPFENTVISSTKKCLKFSIWVGLWLQLAPGKCRSKELLMNQFAEIGHQLAKETKVSSNEKIAAFILVMAQIFR